MPVVSGAAIPNPSVALCRANPTTRISAKAVAPVAADWPMASPSEKLWSPSPTAVPSAMSWTDMPASSRRRRIRWANQTSDSSPNASERPNASSVDDEVRRSGRRRSWPPRGRPPRAPPPAPGCPRSGTGSRRQPPSSAGPASWSTGSGAGRRAGRGRSSAPAIAESRTVCSKDTLAPVGRGVGRRLYPSCADGASALVDGALGALPHGPPARPPSCWAPSPAGWNGSGIMRPGP